MNTEVVLSIGNSTTPLKGSFGGECNRKVCRNKPATWFNQSTRMYYCAACAERINHYLEREIICFETIEVEICRGCGNDYPCNCGCTEHSMTIRRPKNQTVRLQVQE